MQPAEKIIAQLPVYTIHSIDSINEQVQLKNYTNKADFHKAIIAKCAEALKQVDNYCR